MATPSLLPQAPGGLKLPPKKTPKKVPKKKSFSFQESSKALRRQQDTIKEAREEFFQVPWTRQVGPAPKPPKPGSLGMADALYQHQLQAHRESIKANAAWRKTREQEWRDVLSGKTQREAHDEFVSKADKALPALGGGRFGVSPSQYKQLKTEAVTKERKRLEAEWKRMQADPQGYAEEEAKRPKDIVGKISAAGIGGAEFLGLPKSVANDLRLITAGFIPGVAEASKAGYGAFTGNPEAAERMVNDTIEQYRQNYIDGGWKGALNYARKHPVLFTLDASILAAPVAKVGSIGTLTKSFMRANPDMSVVDAAALAARESSRPGLAASKGIKGGIPERTLKGRSYSSDTPRPVSRSPIGRAGQRAYDRWSQSLDTPSISKAPVLRAVSTSARAAAADRKALRRSQARQQALINALQEDVANFTTKKGKARLRRLIGQAVPERGRAESLIAALEAGTDAQKALPERIAALQNVLDQGIMWERKPIESQARRQFVETLTARFTPDQVGALTTLTDSMARAVNPDNPRRWYETHLAESSNMSAEEFIQSGAAAAAQLQTTPGLRRGLLDAGQTRIVGHEAVDQELAAADASRAAGNEQVAIYWNSKDGNERGVMIPVYGGFEKHDFDSRMSVPMTTQEASDFLKQETDGQMWVGSEGASAAFETPVFYSELQRQVEKLPPSQKSASMQNSLRKSVSNEEWEQMGLDAFFDRYGEQEKIPREDLQDFLSDPLNAYNLDEFVRVSYATDYDERTVYDDYGGGSVTARTPTRDEPYHELTMTLGALHPRQAGTGKPYTGRGQGHWEQSNVVVHARFHVITDPEGVRSLLVDEIQSDWASDYRRADSPEWGAETADLVRLREIDEQLDALKAEHKALPINKDDVRTTSWAYHTAQREVEDWGGGDPAELQALERERDRALDRVQEAEESYDAVRDQVNDIAARERDLYAERRVIERKTSFVPPPLGGKELNAAVRRLSRWAAEDGIDRIIVVPGEMQAYRNGAYGVLPGGEQIDVFDWHEHHDRDVDAWQESFGMMNEDELQSFGRSEQASKSGKAGTYFRLYEQDIPRMFEKTLGVKGERREGAFNGYYGDQFRGISEGGEHPMGGYVLDLTPEAKAKALVPMRLFQRQPDWEGLPRGATEFLADGKTALRLFEGAGVDTVVHELAHVALRDLSVEDRAILGEHFGGLIPDWTEQQHEAFARGFEGYLYSGKAPTPELQTAFAKIKQWIAAVWAALKQDPAKYQLTPEINEVYERMVLPKDRSPLTEEQRAYVTSQIADLQHALDNPGDPRAHDAALMALREMSQLVEDHGREIMLFGYDETPDPDTGISPLDAATDDIDRMLEQRRTAYTNLLHSMGIIDPSDTATRAEGYFPNLSIWRTGGSIPLEPTKLPATGNVIGVPKPRPDAVNMKRNQFVRFQTGGLSMNPSVLFDVMRMRVKHLATLHLRQRLFERGEQVVKGKKIEDYDTGVMFIRDPKQEAVKIREQTRAALGMDEDSFMALVERGEDPSSTLDVEDESATASKAMEDNVWWKGKEGPQPAWLVTEDTVRTVPRHIAESLFGEIFPSAPRGGAIAPIANALARFAMLYAPGPIPGSRYVVRNFLQNAVLTGLTHPTNLRHSVYATRRLAKEHPRLAQMIDAEAGSTRAEAALPEYYVRAQTGAQRFERGVTEAQRKTADVLSSGADNPFRRAAWIGYAERYGFHGPEGWQRLLTSEEPNIARTRDLISQAVRDDLIDFDAMSPKERAFASHYFFLYPFIRGSLKWPFMYAREYPFRAGLGGAFAASEGQRREREALAKTTSEMGRTTLKPGGKQFEFGWLDPVGPSAQTFESIAALLQGLPKRDFTAALQMLSPEYRAAVESLSGGASKTRPWSSLLSSFVPGYSVGEKWARGGSLSDQLLRHMGLSVEPGPSRAIQRKQAAADLQAAWQWAQEQGMEASASDVQKSARAYEKFEDLKQRIDFSQKDIGEGSLRTDDLSEAQLLEREQQKALALTAAVAEGFPEYREQMTKEAKQVRSADLAKLEAYNEQLEKYAFAARNNLINTWKRATDA